MKREKGESIVAYQAKLPPAVPDSSKGTSSCLGYSTSPPAPCSLVAFIRVGETKGFSLWIG